MGTHNAKCVADLQEASTEMFGPKSSSEACPLGKGPLQPLSFQETIKVF